MQQWINPRRLPLASFVGLILALFHWMCGLAPRPGHAVETVPGMPPVVDPANLYSGTAAGRWSPAVAGAVSRVYVPNRQSSDVYVIDPATLAVVDRFKVGDNPQHVVPSWDLKTLWVTDNAEGPHRRQPDADRPDDGQARPLDPHAIDTTTGEVKSIPVGKEPHGLAVWPLPGRYSLGHTGDMR